jgi:hypothetical protein
MLKCGRMHAHAELLVDLLHSCHAIPLHIGVALLLLMPYDIINDLLDAICNFLLIIRYYELIISYYLLTCE